MKLYLGLRILLKTLVKRTLSRSLTYMFTIITVTAILSTINIDIVSSTSASYALTSTYNVPDYERAYAYSLLYWIDNAATYGFHHMDNSFRDQQAYRNDIYNAASSSSYNPAHVFFISHGDCFYDGNHLRTYIVTQDGQHVHDNDIYGYTRSRHVRIAFLYPCYHERTIGQTYQKYTCFLWWCWCTTIHSGQPHAWLHTTQLSADRYRDPDGGGYVFIKWYGPAPFLSYDINGDTDVGYRFVGNFYTKLYGYYTSATHDVIEALDYGSSRATGDIFEDSYLYNGFSLNGEWTYVVVYGDGSYGDW